MRTIASLLATGLVLSALACPASAAIYSTSFSGTVTQQSGAGPAVGSTIAGSFDYSSDAGRFLSFTINGISASQPFTSTVTTSPAGTSNPYEAIYSASNSIVQGTGASNTAVTLDLLAYDTFTSGNALTILTTPGLGGQLETQANSFDGNYSFFSYSTGNGTSTTRSFTAALDPNSLSSRVPEPTTLALLAAPMLGLALRRRS